MIAAAMPCRLFAAMPPCYAMLRYVTDAAAAFRQDAAFALLLRR